MIHQIFEHDDPTGPCEHRCRRRKLCSLKRGQRPAVHMEAGQIRERRFREHETSSRDVIEHIRQRFEPAWRHQKRPGDVSGLDGASNDFVALGQEESAFGLQQFAQVDVAQVGVVAKPRIVRVGYFNDLGHRASL